jgi:hypothetical protein
MKEYFTGTDDFQRAYKVNAMISANALVRTKNGALQIRKAPIPVRRWMMDSGAFSQVTKYGDFIISPEEYVRIAVRFQDCGDLACIVTQDYMCEPDVIKMLQDMGKQASVRIHQRKTVERYFEVLTEAKKQGLKVPVMPVLQGWEVEDYLYHFAMYEEARMELGIYSPYEWIGIGSTCKRNKNPEVVSDILDILDYNHGPLSDYKIHLFGYKTTGLRCDKIKDRIYSSDSFAYDQADRFKGVSRTRKDRIKSAIKFGKSIVHNNVQTSLNF